MFVPNYTDAEEAWFLAWSGLNPEQVRNNSAAPTRTQVTQKTYPIAIQNPSLDNSLGSRIQSLRLLQIRSAAMSHGTGSIIMNRAYNLWFIHSLVTIFATKNIEPSTNIVSRLIRTGLYESEADSNDTFVTALRLHEAIEEKDEDSLRLVSIGKKNKQEKDIEYSILLSHRFRARIILPSWLLGRIVAEDGFFHQDLGGDIRWFLFETIGIDSWILTFAKTMTLQLTKPWIELAVFGAKHRSSAHM
jgi:hypothetical protein